MYFIKTETGATVVSNNLPGDDIIEGLLNHFGEVITVARLTSDRDHRRFASRPYGLVEIDLDAHSVRVFQPDSDSEDIGEESLQHATPALIAEFSIEIVYQPPAEPVLPEPTP
jgi:hypothetical protein